MLLRMVAGRRWCLHTRFLGLTIVVVLCWWHGGRPQTENLDGENIAFSSTTMSVNTVDSMRTEMRKECSGAPQRFPFPPDVCEELEKVVYPWWDQAMKGDFAIGKHTCERSL